MLSFEFNLYFQKKFYCIARKNGSHCFNSSLRNMPASRCVYGFTQVLFFVVDICWPTLFLLLWCDAVFKTCLVSFAETDASSLSIVPVLRSPVKDRIIGKGFEHNAYSVCQSMSMQCLSWRDMSVELLQESVDRVLVFFFVEYYIFREVYFMCNFVSSCVLQ